MNTARERWKSHFAPLLVAVFAALVAIAATNSADVLGHYIHTNDITGDYLVGVCWAIFLGMTILFWPVRKGDKSALLVTWTTKCAVALGAMLFYEAHYDFLDAYGYFQLSNPKYPLPSPAIGDGTQNIIALCWLQNKILPYSYSALKISFAMTGLLAIYISYRAVVIFLCRESKRSFYILAFFPSLLFWSSILGKDPIVLLGVSLYAYGVVGWLKRKHYSYLGFLLAGVALAGWIRFWMVPILLAPLPLAGLLESRSTWSRLATTAALTAAILFSVNLFESITPIKSYADFMLFMNTVSRSWAIGGSAQKINVDFTNPIAMVAFLPKGAFTALFRPLPWDAPNLFGFIGLENLGLLILFGQQKT